MNEFKIQVDNKGQSAKNKKYILRGSTDNIDSSCRSKSQCANIAVFDPSYTSRDQLIKSNGS